MEVFETGLEGAEASDVSFAIWRNDTEICTGFGDGQIRITNIDERAIVQSFRCSGPDNAVFSDDGQLLAIAHGAGGRFITIFDGDRGEALCEGLEHRRGILWMGFDAESTMLYTLSRDNSVRMFDAHTGELIKRSNASMLPRAAAWCPRRQWLCVAGERLGGMPGRIRMLNMKTGKDVFEPVEFNAPITAAAFDEQGQLIAIADDN